MARLGRLSRLASLPDSEIDYSDIPPLADEQLAEMAAHRRSNVMAAEKRLKSA